MFSQKVLLASQELMDAERILINPLNHSLSKQQYSFPKAQRWTRCKTETDNYKFYPLPTTKSKITTTIGSSQRQEPTRQVRNPAPNQYIYSVDGQFSSVKKSSKGFCFGLGRSVSLSYNRQEIKIHSFINIKTDVPPPNAYQIREKQHQNQFSFSREKKNRNRSFRDSSGGNVGPGSYVVVGSLDQNRQLLSTQHRHASPKIHESKMETRKKGQEIAPPLYHPRTTAKGEQLDLNRKKRGFRIGTGKRSNLAHAIDIPGPGRYKMFSEFISKGKS